ncbi:MAG: hypothetical protein AAF903_09195 [Pseudomonadota bacterium]
MAYRISVDSTLYQISHTLIAGWSINKAFKVEIGFLDKPGLNAFADELSATYALAMHKQTFRCMNGMANACFADERFFREVGEPEYVSSIKPDVVWSPADAGQNETFILHPCPERSAAASALTQIMARIIWFHEFAHCHNNHIRFLRSRGIADRLCEAPPPLGVAGFPSKSSYRQNLGLHRILELDADDWAIEASLDTQFNGQEPINAIAELKPRLRVKIVFFAVACVGWLLEHFNQGFLSKTHPPHELRSSMIAHALSRYVKQKRPDAMPVLVEAYRELQRLPEFIGGFYDLRDHLQMVKAQNSAGFVERAKADLSDLRSDLSKFNETVAPRTDAVPMT